MRTVVRNSYTPQTGDYCNKIVVDEDKGVQYIFDSDGVFSVYTSKQQEGAPMFYVDSSVNAAKNELKTYADTKDAQVLAEAKQYTDEHGGTGGVTKAYVDDQDASTLASAEAYVDAKSLATVFYSPSGVPLNGESLTLYNDLACTSQTTYAQFQDAILKGPVIVRSAYDGPTSIWAAAIVAAQVEVNLYIDFYLTKGGGDYIYYEWNQEDAAPGNGYVERLARVAATGSYNDLTNRPTIPTITVSNVDIQEGSALPANNFYGVYVDGESE